ELNPDAAGAYRALGFIAMNTDDPPSALKALSSALELDPQDIDARVQFGLLQCHVEECGLGISNLELAARQDPMNPGTFLAIARAKGEAGLLKAANAAFDRAAILDPHHPNLNLVRGYLAGLNNNGSESDESDDDR
ncbi:MAG: tetratricopeptide repeat protein, partial [Gammaproteobacteria bacterium]|nr:tetratricopeptide repeat protein [Gammaproteobacteria bacterium]